MPSPPETYRFKYVCLFHTHFVGYIDVDGYFNGTQIQPAPLIYQLHTYLCINDAGKINTDSLSSVLGTLLKRFPLV